jgi:amino acid permease
MCAAGAGVLGLPASLAWLGWVGGIVALVFFFAVSLWAALMLTEVYMVRGSGRCLKLAAAGGGVQ